MSRIWSDLEDPTPLPGFLPHPRRSLEAALSVAPQTASWWPTEGWWNGPMDPAVLSSWFSVVILFVSWMKTQMKKCNEYRCSYVDGICGFSNIGLFYFHWPTTHDKIQQWLSWIIAETKARPKSCRATEGQLVHDAPWWVFGSKNHLNLPVVENCSFMWKCHRWLQAKNN